MRRILQEIVAVTLVQSIQHLTQILTQQSSHPMEQ